MLVEYGRPGFGIGEGFFVAVILAAAATGPSPVGCASCSLSRYSRSRSSPYGRVDWAALDSARAQDASPDRV